MSRLGSFSGGGLGFGVAFTLRDQFTATSQRIQGEFNKLEARTEAFVAYTNRAMSMVKTGAVMMLVGGALAAPFAIAVNKSMEFNSAMAEVGAISQATAEDFAILKKDAIELGKATKFTAIEAAQGQKYLALAGFQTNDILQAMPGLLSLAAAGNTDLATTSDIVSDTLTAMGLAASETNRVADIMAATMTKSNTSTLQMGDALKYSTGAAQTLGVSMSELSAMIGMMGDMGIKGSMAGTSLQMFLTKITEIGRTSKSADAIAKLGLSLDSFRDSEGNLKSMTEIMPLLIERFKELGNNIDQANVMNDLFDVRGKKVFQAMLSPTAKNFNDFVNVVDDSMGMADRVAEKMLDNLQGDVTKFKSMMESTMISLGDKIEPVLRPIVRNLTSMVALAGAFINTGLGQFIVGVTAALAALLIVVGLALVLKGALNMVTMKLTSAFNAETKAMLMQTIVQKGVIAGMRKMAVAAWASLGPYALIAGAVMIMIAAFRYLSRMLSEGTEKQFKYTSAILLFMGPIGKMLLAIQGTKRGLKEFDKMQRDAFGNYTGIQSGALGFFQKVGGAIRGLTEIWRSWNGETFELSADLSDKLEALGILDFVIDMGTWLVRGMEFGKGFAEGMSQAFNEMKAVIRDVWNFLDQNVFTPMDAVFDMLGISIGRNTSELSKWSSAGKMVADVMVMAFKVVLGPIIAVVKGIEMIINAITWVMQKTQEFSKEALVGKLISGGLDLYNRFMGDDENKQGGFNQFAMAGGGTMPVQQPQTFDAGAKSPMIFRQTQKQETEKETAANDVVNIQFFMDGDEVANKVIDKQRLKDARR